MPLIHLVQLQVKNNRTPTEASIQCLPCSGGCACTAPGLSSSGHSPFLSPHTQEMAKATRHCSWGCVGRLSSCWKQYKFCCFSPPGFCCFPWQLSTRMQQGTLYLQEPPPAPPATASSLAEQPGAHVQISCSLFLLVELPYLQHATQTLLRRQNYLCPQGLF